MASSRPLRLGTRGSRLAMAQAVSVKAQLETATTGLTLEIVPIKTSGDRGDRDVRGAFVKEIENALLDDHVDLALHCLKDLPTDCPPGLTLAAHLEREDPRDAWISSFADVSELPARAIVGTGSPRRTAQLRAVRQDLEFHPLVGNVDTRLRKLQDGEYRAIILAVAGFNRLGLQHTWATDYPGFNLVPLSLDRMLPAPGQAVLVLQARESDPSSVAAAAALNSPITKECADAERVFLSSFGGGCAVPVAALCTMIEGELHLRGLVSSPDGERQIFGTSSGRLGSEVGRRLGEELLGQGAGELFGGVRR